MHSEAMREPERPVSVFLVYAQKDEALKQEFEEYLAVLQQSRLISGWAERQVQSGVDWSQAIDPRMLAAGLIVLMVSPALLASGYCSGAEFRETLERNKTRKQAILIPISLYYVSLHGSPLEQLAFTPRKPIPVASWPERHEAWRDIDEDIRYVIMYTFKV